LTLVSPAVASIPLPAFAPTLLLDARGRWNAFAWALTCSQSQ
jgi:hypothetical protein